jgi:RHS repeat-associated protein
LGDVPVAVYDGARNLVQQFVYLPGGVSVTLGATATSRTWSFPNLHGHVTATSNDNGDPLTSVVYDPWGVALNPAPNNVSGTADLAGFGGNGRLTESTTTKPVTHMGARPYTASTARFLTVDPIHGGCANHYVYGFGVPLNAQDLTGKGIFDWADDLWDATGGKVVSWVNDNACGIANWAGTVATAAAAVAVGAALAAATVATGGLASLAAAAAYASLGASAVQLGAGAVARDRSHMINGGLGVFFGGVASAGWKAAGALPEVSKRAAAAMGLYSEASGLGIGLVASYNVDGGC